MYAVFLVMLFVVWHVLFFVAYFMKSKKKQQDEEQDTVNKLMGGDNDE